MPATQQMITSFFIHIRHKGLLNNVIALNHFLVIPIAYCQTCKIGSAHGSGFNADRAFHLNIDDVRLRLHQEAVGTGTAINL